MNKIKVLIADDHAILREGIIALLNRYDDIEVVGEAGDGKQAIERAQELKPDIILMDIAMPGLGGLEATLELRKSCPKSKILVLTQYDNKEYVLRFLRAGASGYVLKKAVGTELVAAIRAVYSGGSFLHPSVAARVVEEYVQGAEKTQDPYDSLTDREKQVLKLVAEGFTNKEVADLLCISVKTVMAHRANLMEKLAIHSRTDLVKYALRKGLIDIR